MESPYWLYLGCIGYPKSELSYASFSNIYADKRLEFIKFGDFCQLRSERRIDHFIIQASPAIEKFIVRNAQTANINLEDFRFSANLDLLKKEAKKVNTKSDQRFKGLFKSIFKQWAPDFLRLKNWLMYLKEKNYNADVNELKQL